MDEKTFGQMLKKLEGAFRCTVNESTSSIYYERLKHFDEEVLMRAMNNLVDTYEKKAIPLVSEIKIEAEEVQRELAIGSAHEREDCIFCFGFGVLIIKLEVGSYKHSIAKVCTCLNGKRYEKSFEQAIRKNQKGIYRIIPPQLSLRKDQEPDF